MGRKKRRGKKKSSQGSPPASPASSSPAVRKSRALLLEIKDVAQARLLYRARRAHLPQLPTPEASVYWIRWSTGPTLGRELPDFPPGGAWDSAAQGPAFPRSSPEREHSEQTGPSASLRPRPKVPAVSTPLAAPLGGPRGRGEIPGLGREFGFPEGSPRKCLVILDTWLDTSGPQSTCL